MIGIGARHRAETSVSRGSRLNTARSRPSKRLIQYSRFSIHAFESSNSLKCLGGGPKLPLRSPTRPNPFLAKNLGFPSGGTPSVTSNNLTLHVKGIPRELPGKALVEHFAKFGKIDKIERNLSKLYATVTYANHVRKPLTWMHAYLDEINLILRLYLFGIFSQESAVKAKGLGKCIKHDQDEFLVHMFWHAGELR